MDREIMAFVESGCSMEAVSEKIYPESVNRAGDGVVFMADMGAEDVLISVDCPGFEGEELDIGDRKVTVAQLSHANACALRQLFEFTKAQPVLDSKRTIGLGDRLGIAIDGHIRAIKDCDIMPIFAQQSIRELTLTHRTFDDVMDTATFGVFRNGFRRGFGGDGDHLKTEPEVQYAIDCGYTMITLDCSEHIHDEGADMDAEELCARVSVDPELEARYLGRVFAVEDYEISFDSTELKRCLFIYGEAIDFAAKIYHEFIEMRPLNFELSIDETASPTKPGQHFFVANELKLRGVQPVTIAPRFCGEFQKGIDYIGDVNQYEEEFAVHAAIARTFGYKISIHSGSDKFSVFRASGRLSRGNFHIKTAGTNWLEAMMVVAIEDPALYREVHAYALEHFDEAAKYYHVTTRLDLIPALHTLSDEELPGLFELNDARQLIHITYGLILTAEAPDGTPLFKDRLYTLWREHREEYAERLDGHIGRHLELLYADIDDQRA